MNNKNDNKIDILSDDDWGAVINCAVRYALGRRTYMPGLVIDTISPYLNQFSNKTLWCLERDLEEAGRFPGGYGDEKIDKPLWLNLLNNVKEELVRRDPNRKGFYIEQEKE